MRSFLTLSFFAITICLLSLSPVACSCGDDDDSSAGDDDADDDTSDDDTNDDDTADDDTADDDTEAGIVQHLFGGTPGGNGTQVAFIDGAPTIIADYARNLLAYRVTEGKAVSKTTIAPHAYIPDVEIDGSGHVHILFHDLIDYTYAIGTNRSGAWETIVPELETDEPDDSWDGFGVNADGEYAVVYKHDDENSLVVSHNLDGAWATETIDDTVGAGFRPDIAIDSVGNLHAVYQNRSSDEFRYATNASGSWESEILDTGNNMGDGAVLKVGPGDVLHLAYLDSFHNTLYYASKTPSGDWAFATVDADNVRYDLAMVVDASGVAHIVYGQGSTGDFRYAQNATGTWASQDITLDDFTNVGLAIASNGDIYISAYNFAEGELQLLSNATGPWTRTAVATGVDEEEDFAVASDATGHAHLIGTRPSLDQVVHMNDASGAWNSEAIDAETTTNWPAMLFDDDGYLHAMYVNSDGDLEYATNAHGSWVTQIIDGEGNNTGRSLEIGIDGDGALHASYLFYNSKWLKYATNKTGSWVVSVVDAGPVNTNQQANAVLSDGTVYIAYLSDSNELRVVENSTGAWQFTTLEAPDVPDQFFRLETDANDHLHFLYATYDDETITYGTNASGDWEYEPAFFMDETDASYYTQMAIADDGSAHIVTAPYDWVYGYEVGVYYITNMSGEWQSTLFDPAWRSGRDIRVAVTPSDEVLVYYTGLGSAYFARFPAGYAGR
ncbi:MAG: hypothetical protein H6684_10140 [Deltaproteobacteria bacterium]|nr:hypothetical protein [Deltaproteobacteria bacterium]